MDATFAEFIAAHDKAEREAEGQHNQKRGMLDVNLVKLMMEVWKEIENASLISLNIVKKDGQTMTLTLDDGSADVQGEEQERGLR